MSTQALGEVTGESQITARIAQIQALMAQTAAATGTGALASGTGAGTAQPLATAASAGSFQSVLASAQSSAAGASEGGQYEGLIQQAAARYGVDPAVLHGLIQQESGFNPNAQSGAGAQGLTQLMPGTAATLGVSNPMNPAEAIEGGARYLAQLTSQFGGNTTDALAAYNAGPAAVSQYGGVPPYAETQSYVEKVLGYAESYRQGHAQTVGVAA